MVMEKRGRGRPPKNPANAGRFVGISAYRRDTRKAEKRAVREEVLKDVEVLLEEARSTRASCPLPDAEALEDRTVLSAAALSERVNLDCRALVQIAKRYGILKDLPERNNRCCCFPEAGPLPPRNEDPFRGDQKIGGGGQGTEGAKCIPRA